MLISGDLDTFDNLLYGAPHPRTEEFIRSQFTHTPTHNLTKAGLEFINQGRQIYEQIQESKSLRAVRAAFRSVASIWNKDEIKYVSSIDECQQLPRSMLRWVMSDPTLREKAQKQQIDGYSDVYQDIYPDIETNQHPDYRKLTNGVVFFNESCKEGEPYWYADSYYDDCDPDYYDSVELDIVDQVNLLDSIKSIKRHLLIGLDDPTSRYNGSL